MVEDLNSQGQRLAIEQLEEIAEQSCGQLKLIEIVGPEKAGEGVHVRLSVSTDHYERVPDSLNFRKREPLRLYIPADFPFSKPSVYFGHIRFIGKPHVQWGSYICLYQSSELEWVASDGMFGFVQRLNNWLHAAAKNELDPDDAPLHPPVAYTSSKFKFVAQANAPVMEEGNRYWLGACRLSKRNRICYDLDGWSKLGEGEHEEDYLAAAILLSSPMPMEYPQTVFNLVKTLKKHGLEFTKLCMLLWVYATRLNNEQDLFLVLGAPMRRKAAGETLKQHLTVWRIPYETITDLKKAIGRVEENLEQKEEATKAFIDWTITANAEWCKVYENREEVTNRRDIKTAASWFLGKRVLILGCGALGSHLAESITRASPEKLVLVDNDTVSAGVLVRQAFCANQIGFTKSSALAVRLKELMIEIDVEGYHKDLRKGVFAEFDSNDFDLVIDATASRSVNLVIERELSSADVMCPIVSCAISRGAEFGRIMVRMPGHKSGMYSVLRGSKVQAHLYLSFLDFIDGFWPNSPKETYFQPEPGCSEPTFVASNTDVAWYAASFLNSAVKRLRVLKTDQAEVLFFNQENHFQRLAISNMEQYVDVINNFSVLMSPAARKAIHAELAQNSRSGNELDETGGLLFGEIDDSLRKAWVDFASGPPPDSIKSPELFQCGIKGTKELNARYEKETRGSTKFIGVWHTHPISLPDPSQVDLSAMVKILHFQERSPRHVIMLIVGYASTEPLWQFHLFKRNQFILNKVSG